METPFTLLDGVTRAMQAIDAGICRFGDGNDFARWLADTYENDFVEYVNDLSTDTLYGRFLLAQAVQVTK